MFCEEKKGLNSHKEPINKLFCFKIFTTNTLTNNAYKCSNVTRTKCPIAMYKISKNEFFGNFGPLIEHGPHWINFIIFTFISEIIDNVPQQYLDPPP